MAAMPLPTLALGLGELEMQSFLNEPLRAELALLDTRELTPDDIRIRLAGVEDFERLGVDRSYFLTGIQFEIDLDPSAGRGVIRLSTREAVLEPYLDIIVEARWPNGRVLREYTVLVDPPAFREEMVTVSASERVDDLNPDKPALAEESRAAMQADAETGRPAAPVVESTGDRVALRQSSLAPGEMPDRPFSAQTSDTPTAGNRYMVKRDETLWQIAARGRPQDISVQQAMLDIQRINPEAFIDGNINRIKAGYIIYLPAQGEVASEDLTAALEEVRAQNRAFEAERSLPGVSAAATLRVSADPQAAGPDDAEEEPGPRASATAMDSGAAEAEEAEGIAGAEGVPSDTPVGESAEAGGASEALAADLAAMSARLDTLEQIVSLKDEQIATLERALREAREDAAAAAARAAAAPPASRPAPSGPAPAPRSELPWLPILGGLLILALVLVLFLRRRGNRARPLPEVPAARAAQRKNDDVFAGVSLKKEAFADELEAQPGMDTAAAAGALFDEAVDDKDARDRSTGESAPVPSGSRGYGESKNDDYIDDGSGSDALAEADIYIAYGRYLQAVELLNTAIDAEPGNSAYRLKLIELYVDMGEVAKATDQLTALRAKGDADAIERGEALVGGAAAPARAPEAAPFNAATEAVRSEGAAGLSEPAASAVPQFTPEPTPGDSAADRYEPVAAPEPPVLDSGERRGDDAAALDAGAYSAPEEESLELDLAEDERPAGAAGDADDWVPEFDQLEIESSGVEEETAAAEPEEVLDLTDALADFEGGDYQDDGDEDDENEFMIADDADQMATKLDLARAYLDMGDSDGARTILREVADSGSDEQQQEARELLSRIG